jgi:hypothetical protein
LIELAIGLIGVVVGALVSGLKDWVTSYFSMKAKRKYLATRVISMLEIFVDNCALVMNDDGTVYGMPDKDGCFFPQVEPPVFQPLTLDVDWLSIDANLMHKILYLPNEIYMVDSKIQSIWKYSATLPHNEEIFSERYYQYAKLAVKANEIIDELSRETGINISSEHRWYDSNLFKEKVEALGRDRN